MGVASAPAPEMWMNKARGVTSVGVRRPALGSQENGEYHVVDRCRSAIIRDLARSTPIARRQIGTERLQTLGRDT